jgi:hypothetical protein
VVSFIGGAIGLVVSEEIYGSQVQTFTRSWPLPAGGTFGVSVAISETDDPWWVFVPPALGIATGLLLILWDHRREARISAERKTRLLSGYSEGYWEG